MQQTLRWLAVVACLLAALSSTARAQEKPGMMPSMPSGTMGMAPGKASTSGMPAAGLLDVNSASESDLTKLKGIGPVRAKAIVAYRQQNGPFKSVDDLEKVKGIGKKILAQIKDQVTIR